MVMMSGSVVGSRMAEGVLMAMSLHLFIECLNAEEDGSVSTFAEEVREVCNESAACEEVILCDVM
jgi:hypothetical protein